MLLYDFDGLLYNIPTELIEQFKKDVLKIEKETYKKIDEYTESFFDKYSEYMIEGQIQGS